MISMIYEPDVSHHGNLDLVEEMIKVAAVCGAQFFKIQCFNTTRLGKNWGHKTRYYQSCQFSDADIKQILFWVKDYNMELLVTVNDSEQPGRVFNLGVDYVKVAGGQLNPLLLGAIAQIEWKGIILSTGMSTGEEIDKALLILRGKKYNKPNIVLMHCTSLYPTEDSQVNMNRLNELIDTFGDSYQYGYSDHTTDNLASTGAMFMGADYIEVHVHMEGTYSPVACVGATPEEFREMCLYRDRIVRMFGDGAIDMGYAERQTRKKYEGRWLI